MSKKRTIKTIPNLELSEAARMRKKSTEENWGYDTVIFNANSDFKKAVMSSLESTWQIVPS